MAYQGGPPSRPERPSGRGRHSADPGPEELPPDGPGRYDESRYGGYDSQPGNEQPGSGQPGSEPGRADQAGYAPPAAGDYQLAGYGPASQRGYAAGGQYAEPGGYRLDEERPEHPGQWRDEEPMHGRPASEDWPGDPQWPTVVDWPESADEPARPPGRPAARHPGGPGQDPRGNFDDTDADIPAWAALTSGSDRPRRRRRPAPAGQETAAAEDPAAGGRSRVSAGKKRRSKRRLATLTGAAAVLVALVAGVIWVLHPKQPAAGNDGYVNSLQRGDLRSVPDACRVLSSATLNSDLAGVASRRQLQPNAGSLLSQCSYTVDSPPVFRVLQVSLQVYRPSLLAAGNGSADSGAKDAYFTAQRQLADPSRKSGLPKAAISPLAGTGQAGFSALQVIRTGGDVNDLVTVVVRSRNALVTISLQALDRSHRGHYGPVTVSQLQASALATARAALAKVAAGPVAG